MVNYFQLARQNFSKKNLGGQGVSLYLAIVIMTALLAIVLGVTGILVSQIKMIRGMEDSVIAFFAADTGSERGLEYVSSSPPPSLPATFDGFLNIDGDETGTICPGDLTSNPGDACYVVGVYASSDANCSGISPLPDYYCIKSNGFYKKTIRAIETHR